MSSREALFQCVIVPFKPGATDCFSATANLLEISFLSEFKQPLVSLSHRFAVWSTRIWIFKRRKEDPSPYSARYCATQKMGPTLLVSSQTNSMSMSWLRMTLCSLWAIETARGNFFPRPINRAKSRSLQSRRQVADDLHGLQLAMTAETLHCRIQG